mmetsp:Transcript_15942/g.27827  ORF Transcript_15942/g.27827 Transcript_15942/m.27827 type:complete len:113 (-) Transcript_15942:1655-1993(-)
MDLFLFSPLLLSIHYFGLGRKGLLIPKLASKDKDHQQPNNFSFLRGERSHADIHSYAMNRRERALWPACGPVCPVIKRTHELEKHEPRSFEVKILLESGLGGLLSTLEMLLE